MNKTSSTAIILVIICTLFTSTAQVLYKVGANKLDFNDYNSLLTNYYLGGGIILYGIAAILLIYSFKYGELSVVFPMIATSYIWVSIMSIYFFNEAFTLVRGIGIATVIIGVTFIGIGGKQSLSTQQKKGEQLGN